MRIPTPIPEEPLSGYSEHFGSLPLLRMRSEPCDNHIIGGRDIETLPPEATFEEITVRGNDIPLVGVVTKRIISES